jgi:O-antigen ligase
MRIYTSFAVFLFFAIALVARSGLSIGPALLVLGSFALFFMHSRSPLIRSDYQLIAVLGSYFLVCVTMNLIHNATGPEYDAPLRFLYVIPALILLLACPPSSFAIWGGIAVGAIGAGVFAAWEILALSYERAEGFNDSIQYGNVSIVLGMLCLAGVGWATRQHRSAYWTTLLIIGTLCGIFGSVFTGSRGSWICLPFCLTVLYCGSTLKKKHWIIGSIVLVAVLIMLYITPRTAMKERIVRAVSETSDYLNEHNTGTSIGARLEMWRTGVLLLNEKPLLGWGKEGYMHQVQQLINKGKIDAVTKRHNHLHNEYLDAWVKRGVPGLAVTLALFLVPLILFVRQFRSGNNITRPYALAGIVLVIAYIVFGFTQAFLTHNNGVMLYAFSVAILWAASRHPALASENN